MTATPFLLEIRVSKNLTIFLKFNSEGNFGIGGVKGIVKGGDSILLDDHETVIHITSALARNIVYERNAWKKQTNKQNKTKYLAGKRCRADRTISICGKIALF